MGKILCRLFDRRKLNNLIIFKVRVCFTFLYNGVYNVCICVHTCISGARETFAFNFSIRCLRQIISLSYLRGYAWYASVSEMVLVDRHARFPRRCAQRGIM